MFEYLNSDFKQDPSLMMGLKIMNRIILTANTAITIYKAAVIWQRPPLLSWREKFMTSDRNMKFTKDMPLRRYFSKRTRVRVKGEAYCREDYTN